MLANITLAERAQDGVGQRMQAGIGIAVPFEAVTVRDFHAAQDDMIAGGEAVGIEAHTGSCFAHIREKEAFGCAEILSRRDLEVGFLAFDGDDAKAGALGERHVVRRVAPRTGAVDFLNHVEAKTLRGLCPVNTVTRHGAPVTACVAELQGVVDGEQRHHRFAARLEGCNHPADQIG
jgi:hypothetical protein